MLVPINILIDVCILACFVIGEINENPDVTKSVISVIETRCRFSVGPPVLDSGSMVGQQGGQRRMLKCLEKQGTSQRVS
ncbi:hypothetical protein [Burkholderia territorii]|uniref:hypothetical protein n=1 Tax=Burkholderia territorii TaxID=1503055 RepID=UPI00075980A9|nr:hypothetical protein [Burkholderia territorii]KUZ34833.1 hypothetical protein WS52_17520 [Burkholderia territorii]KUZ59644.1 hypothetical protein WS53_07020 [Burkholderia territorii]